MNLKLMLLVGIIEKYVRLNVTLSLDDVGKKLHRPVVVRLA